MRMRMMRLGRRRSNVEGLAGLWITVSKMFGPSDYMVRHIASNLGNFWNVVIILFHPGLVVG